MYMIQLQSLISRFSLRRYINLSHLISSYETDNHLLHATLKASIFFFLFHFHCQFSCTPFSNLYTRILTIDIIKDPIIPHISTFLTRFFYLCSRIRYNSTRFEFRMRTVNLINQAHRHGGGTYVYALYSAILI